MRKSALLQRFVASQGVYDLLRVAYLAYLRLVRKPHEPDFLGFRFMDCAGLVVDVGANGGQAAVTFANMMPRAEIMSFEANPALEPGLKRIGRLLGKRFSFRIMGLGATTGELPFHVPFRGTLPVTTRASFGTRVPDRYARSVGGHVQTVSVPITTMDELNLTPAVVKIDVEGFEFEVIKGMSATIARCHPVIIAEREMFAECRDFLARHGYAAYRFDGKSRRLHPVATLADAPGTVNIYFATEEGLARFRGP